MPRDARDQLKGVRKKRTRYEVFVKRNGKVHTKSMPLSATADQLRHAREELLGTALAPAPPAPKQPEVEPGFWDDAETYLGLVKAMPSFDDRVYDIREWAKALGNVPRSTITHVRLKQIIEAWRLTGAKNGGPLSNSSLNKRRTALMSLWTTLDGKGGRNPVKDVKPKDETASADEIKAFDDPRVIYRIIGRIGRPRWKTRRKVHQGTKRRMSKTKARLLWMAWSGWPQTQVANFKPEHMNWKDLLVTVTSRKKGKGFRSRILPLVQAPPEWLRPGWPDQHAALRALRRLIKAEALGAFSRPSMRSAWLRGVAAENAHRAQHGRPLLPECYPYWLRHTFGTQLALRITDERVLQEMMLHSKPEQTRRYTKAATAHRLARVNDLIREAADAKVGRKVGPEQKVQKTA